MWRNCEMATASQLRELRRKFGLGEFRSKGASPRSRKGVPKNRRKDANRRSSETSAFRSRIRSSGGQITFPNRDTDRFGIQRKFGPTRFHDGGDAFRIAA